MIQGAPVSWNELEPVLRRGLEGLQLTEPLPEFRDEFVRRDRDPVDVAKDILNFLESQRYFLIWTTEHAEGL